MIRDILLLDADDVRHILSPRALVSRIGEAFDHLPVSPDRTMVEGDGCSWVVMPSYSPGSYFMCKASNVSHTSRSDGRPLVNGLCLVFRPDGTPSLIADAYAVTTCRTAALAAYVTDRAARRDAKVLALFGAGRLAHACVEALMTVRPLTEVRIVSRHRESSERLSRELQAEGVVGVPSSPKRACEGADIITTCTTSPTPVFKDAWVNRGTHINAMGQYRPERREIPSETIVRAKVIVETISVAMTEAGDLIIPRDEGLFSPDDIVCEVGDQYTLCNIRKAEDDVTLLKSVGHAAADMAACQQLLGYFDNGSSLANHDGANR